jgi:N-acetylneuraminic acid mutarotase
MGNVGIGTTAPGGKLGILSGWGNWIRFDDSIAGNRYMFHNPGDGSRFEIGVYDAAAATERWGVFVIRPSGNVGIGTTTPAEKLTVAGNIDVTGNRIVNLATPINSTDAATKGYVDAQGGGALPSGAYIAFPDPNPRSGFVYTGAIETVGDQWTNKSPMPTPRYYLAAAVVNNIIYAIGGYRNTYLSTNEAYDPSTGTWTTKAPMPTARAYLAAAAVNNIIYAIGGANVSGILSTNEAYDPSTNTWTTKAPMPTPRYYLAAAAVNNIIYAIGGADVSGYLSTNEAYNPSTNTWTTRAPMPTARAYLAAAAVNNIIYAIGGSSDSGILSTNEAYNPSTNSWTTRAPMPTARYGLAAAVANNIIYAIGGSGGSSTNEAYDPSTNSWTNKSGMLTGRYGLVAAAVNNIIYAIGGYEGGRGILSTNEAYTPPPSLTLYWFRKQ